MLDPTSLLPRPGEALLLLAVWALVQTIRGDLGRRRALGGVLIVVFALASLRVLGAERDAGANQVAVAHGISLGIGLLGLGLVLFQFGRAWRARGLGAWRPCAVDRDKGELPATLAHPTDRTLLGLHLLGALTALAVQHLHLFMPAMLISVVAGELFERRASRTSQLPITLVATVAAMGVVGYFLAHVAGGQPLLLATLPEAPYSAAFELGASLVLCLVAYRLLGLWPLHGARQGPAAPLLAGILLVRLVLPVLPNGLEHWQPFLYLLVAIAAWHAALASLPVEAFTSIAALGLLSGGPTAAWAGLALVAGMVTLGFFHRVRAFRWIPLVARWLVFPMAGLIGLLLLLPTLSAGLAVEVFYSVAAVSGVVVLLWRVDPRQQPGHICGSSARDSSG